MCNHCKRETHTNHPKATRRIHTRSYCRSASDGGDEWHCQDCDEQYSSTGCTDRSYSPCCNQTMNSTGCGELYQSYYSCCNKKKNVARIHIPILLVVLSENKRYLLYSGNKITLIIYECPSPPLISVTSNKKRNVFNMCLDSAAYN
eukprot:789130_1